MKLRLLVIGPNNRTFSHITAQPSIRLGSNPDCEVAIPTDVSSVVSRYHALIDLTDEGVFITDFHSTNGTYVNGKKLTERTPLRPSDEIRLGQQGPIVRAFLIAERPEAEGTILESARPPAPAKAPLPPPPPLPFAITAPPSPSLKPAPLPAMRQSRDEDEPSRRDDRARRSPGKSITPLYLWIVGGVVLSGAVAGILIWQLGGKKKGDDPNRPLSSEEIFNRTVASSTFIEVDLGSSMGTGSGSLIDKDRKLVLTAYHVIDGAKPDSITVTFAKYKDGKLLSSKSEYGDADRVKAKLWRGVKEKDLAILQLDSVPGDAHPLPLAGDSPRRGEDVHTVGGSPRESIGLWIYSKGNVREVQKDRFWIETGEIVAWVIRTSNPINEGDSGGALVNNKCELVGVCCANMGKRTDKTGKTETTADLVRAFIDIREVKQLLDSGAEAKNDKEKETKLTK